MYKFIFPDNWNELLEKENISPNTDFNNFCEDYNQEDFDEILREEGVSFLWREYTELLKMEGDYEDEN